LNERSEASAEQCRAAERRRAEKFSAGDSVVMVKTIRVLLIHNYFPVALFRE
jgi:hypothetical protein